MAMTLVMVGSSFDFLHGLHLCYKLRRFWPPWNRLNRLWLPSPIFPIVSLVFFESKQKGHASWHSLCNDEIAGFPWVFRQSRRFPFIHCSRDRIRHRTSMMAAKMICHRAIRADSQNKPLAACEGLCVKAVLLSFLQGKGGCW